MTNIFLKNKLGSNVDSYDFRMMITNKYKELERKYYE